MNLYRPFAVGFLLALFRDEITGEVEHLDITIEQAQALGYVAVKSNRISLDEYEGAMDPAYLERKRLDRDHGKTHWQFIHE